jgi:6,7-dimethyl-8-ribityllumazine synthase
MSVEHVRPEADGQGLRIALVAAQWNEAIVKRLVDGAVETLRARGVSDDDIEVQWVPGSFELPTAAGWAAAAGRRRANAGAEPFDAVIALGCVIRGETEHFRLVADGAAQGLMQVALGTGMPVLNAVLAVENVAQAEARSGGVHGNTGSQAALAALRMANLRRRHGGPS